MALETITSGAASTIADLDPNSPGNGEDVGQGDDHLRNIKHAIQLTWPNLSDTCSGVASELAFAHKGGTVSGSAVIKGDVHVQGSLSVSGTIIGAGAVLGTLDVSATISGSAKEAAFARSASLAYSAVHALSANFAQSASKAARAVSASRALNCSSANFAASASLAYSSVHALSANTSLSANRAASASRALNCSSANYAGSAGFAASLSGQGALAKLDTVGSAQIDTNAVQQSEIDASAVGTTQLKSTTADHDYATPGIKSYLTLTGGLYVMGVQWGMTGGTGTDELAVGFGTHNLDTDTLSYVDASPASGGAAGLIAGDRVDNLGSRGSYYYQMALQNIGNDTLRVRERYVQSSPPYDLGDGEVYGFVLAQIAPDGTVGAFSIMEDPPWYNNGPTDCCPDKYIYNKDKTIKTPMKLVTRVDGLSLLDVKEDEKKKEHYMKMRLQGRNITKEYEPISHQMKNADMDIIPTNWPNPAKNHTVVMLDPMSETVKTLMEMTAEGVPVFYELFFNKSYMKIGNTALNRKAPKKLMPVGCRFK